MSRRYAIKASPRTGLFSKRRAAKRKAKELGFAGSPIVRCRPKPSPFGDGKMIYSLP